MEMITTPTQYQPYPRSNDIINSKFWKILGWLEVFVTLVILEYLIDRWIIKINCFNKRKWLIKKNVTLTSV